MRRPSSNLGQATIACGLQRGVASVPRGYVHEDIILHRHGVSSALRAFGDALLQRGGAKTRASAAMAWDDDIGVSRLGYYTDNGAFYYYNTEANSDFEEGTTSCSYAKNETSGPSPGCKTYQETLVAIKNHLERDLGLEIQYFREFRGKIISSSVDRHWP